MSLVAISGNASGTGTLTIAAPNTNSNYTLTLPTNTGTIVTNKTAGTVLQVVNATYSSTTSSSSSSYADTGLTATITLSSTSSKVLVIVDQAGLLKQTNDTNINLKLLRNGSDLAIVTSGAGYTGTTTPNYVGNSGISYLDSPASISALTYKTQIASANNNASVVCQTNGSVSTITLMEIAA